MIRTTTIFASLFIGLCLAVSGFIWHTPQTVNSWWHNWQNTGTEMYLHYAKTDPILALPDSDLAQLTSSTQALADSLILLEPYFDTNDYKIIEDSLYPIDFLATLPSTEQARRDFIQTPNQDQAATYHQQLQTSLTIYRQDLNGLRDILETGYHSVIFNFFDGTLKNKDLISQLTQLDTHVQNLQLLDRQRFACLDHYTNSCQYLNTSNQTDKKSSSDEINASVLEKSELIDNYNYIDTYYFSSSTERQMPAIIADSRCYLKDEPAVYAWGLDRSRTSQLPMIKATIINELYFYNLDKLQTENTYFSYLATTTPSTYSLQPTNPYMCFRFDTDLHRILTATHIYSQLQKTDFANWPLTTTQREALSNIRQNTSYVPVAQIEEFLAELLSLNATQLTPLQIKQREAWRLSERTNSAGLVPIIGLVDDMMHTNIHVLPHRNQELLPFFLYRSYIPALYLFANQTLVTPDTSILDETQSLQLEQFDLSTTTDIYTEYTTDD